MEPDVLHLILCDDVQADPSNYHRYNIIGLITSIRSKAEAAFPLVRPHWLALVVWSGGAGSGELTLRIIEGSSGVAIHRMRSRQVRFVGDPGAVGGVVFHIHNCSFPAAGLYWVEVLFSGSVIGRQRLFVRAGEMP